MTQEPEPPLTGWRTLVGQLRDYGGDDWLDDAIQPYVERHEDGINTLRVLGQPHSAKVAIDDRWLRWDLYALQRLFDILIAPYQQVVDDPDRLNRTSGQEWWPHRIPDISVLPGFIATVGASVIDETEFSPFFHEIVGVIPNQDPDAPITLVEEKWPGCLLNSLLLCRSGVVVDAGANHLDPVGSASSPMYWAWWRRNRRAVDLSHNWGHNSQWTTKGRRDYLPADEFLYNADSALDPRPHRGDPDADQVQLAELVRYRSATTRPIDSEQWPFDTAITEPRRHQTAL